MVSPESRRREWSLGLSLAADTALLAGYAVVSVGAASLPLLAETLRGGILMLLGWWILATMRRVHRGHLPGYDYGSGKLERFANFLVGSLLLLGAVWVVTRTIGAWLAGPLPPGSGAWLMAAQVLAAVNVVLNGAAFLALWRAARDGTSLLMAGQVQARLGKLVTSVLVLASVAITTNWPGTQLAWIANLAGGLLVAAVMCGIGLTMLRETLPDLLDRALEERLQRAINKSLGAHFQHYETLERVRSRQSGGRAHIEIALGFAPSRPFGEVAEVARQMARELEAMIPGAEVVVVPVTVQLG
ncbi:cation diffusion facilitator family transporter [Falsiroseomonas sp.]|uniref:cation diffusion facilitator family transporter n=1 Tax=Falsiroseomonas sp. TaxID=2870721 RepID=UPI002716C41B|nr:cation transporter [Falsiroseomonas sp.]MDO9502440.1 cation transporter [Falsiroseomonas sp.]MDP3414505.1 cation transporter [Falsiroseomonas sp.]